MRLCRRCLTPAPLLAGLALGFAALGCGGSADAEPPFDASWGDNSALDDTGSDECSACVDGGPDANASEEGSHADTSTWPVEVCDDQLDNDGNGKTDCLDGSCFVACGCQLDDLCTNGVDDDCDGLVDCADPLCSQDACCDPSSPSPLVEMCSNELDDDCDGEVDCMDPDCALAGCCNGTQQSEICDNGQDDDCDGKLDCLDSDCPAVGCACSHPAQCPLPPGPCESRSCDEGVCSTTPFVGWLLRDSWACRANACLPSGQVGSSSAESQYTTGCTWWHCEDGGQGGGNAQAGFDCGDGLACDGAGVCVGCADASTCPPGDECRTPTCLDGSCGYAMLPDGYSINAQKPGDCRVIVCNKGMGTEAVDDTDVPDDGVECTWDVCTNGNDSNQPRPAGTPCTEGGGSVCDGAGSCV